MPQKNEPPVMRVHFVKEEVSLDRFVRGTMGCSLDELIRDVKRGKYDHIIKREEATAS